MNKKNYSLIITSFTILIEIYKMLMGSMFVVFANGKCEDHRCNWYENFDRNNTFFRICYAMNVLTLFVFLVLYSIEISRERILNKYIITNHHKATDNDSVKSIIDKLDKNEYEKILHINKSYRTIGVITFFVFIINTILSGIITYGSYFDDKSGPDFVSNVLLIGGKIYDIYKNVSTEKYIIISAYESEKKQFNYIKNQLENKETEVV